MEQITEGIYMGTESIDVPATELFIGKYSVGDNVLGKVEHEDLAARFIEKAKENDGWVAVTYKKIAQDVERDMKAGHEYARQMQARRRVQAGLGYKLKKFFGREPDVPEVTKPEVRSDLASLLHFRLGDTNGALSGAINGMVSKGYLVVHEEDEDTVLEPTQRLAEIVYEAQRRRGWIKE